MNDKEIKFESLISILPIGVVVVNEDRKITFMNPYARDTIVGKNLYNKDITLIHKTEKEKNKILDYFSRLSNSKNVELPIVKILDLNNRPSMFIVKLTKIYDREENFKGIVVIFYDLTVFTLSKSLGTDHKIHTVMDKLPIIQKDKAVFLDTEEILFIRSVGSSSLIFDNKGKTYHSNLRISELEDKLDSKGFFRCHKSYLINLKFIKEMNCKNNKCRLYLKTGNHLSVPISRRNKSKLSKIFTTR